MLEYFLFSLSCAIWFAIVFGIKYYIDRLIESDPIQDDTDQGEQLLCTIANKTAELLEEAQSCENEGDIYSYKISSRIVNELDNLFAQLEEYKGYDVT